MNRKPQVVVYNPKPIPWNGLPRVLSCWIESLQSNCFWEMLLDNVKVSALVWDGVMRAVGWQMKKRLCR